jgi:hypothetical protein
MPGYPRDGSNPRWIKAATVASAEIRAARGREEYRTQPIAAQARKTVASTNTHLNRQEFFGSFFKKEHTSFHRQTV